MKHLGFIGLIAGVALVWYVLSNNKRETFTPEFLDQGNVKKTVSTMKSSYIQDTNHFRPEARIDEPIEGVKTPFRVNMFNSYME